MNSSNFSHILKPLVFILAGLVGANASGWTSHEECEGTINERVPGFFTLTTYSNDQVGTGSTSCQMGIKAGTDGWATWGGSMSFPSTLAKGQELWIRLSMFVPNDFNYSGSPQLKFMRTHTRASGGGNAGYLDFLITPDGPTHWDDANKKQTDSPYYYYYETVVRQEYPGVFSGDRIEKGVWESYEIYYKFDTLSVDEGGTGVVRIWKNNKLLSNLTNQITLNNSTTVADSFYLFTYWNGNAPKDQHLYIDDIIMTSDTPANTDDNGFRFIGGSIGSDSRSVSPMPPSGLEVILQ